MNRKARRAASTKGSPVTPRAAADAQQSFADGVRHHQAGRLNDAERSYRQVLKVDPRHADSLHLLGLVAYQAARPDLAFGLIEQALTINAKAAPFHASLGTVLVALGKPDEAIASYRRSIDLKPDYGEAFFNIAALLKGQGKLDEAAAQYRQAISFKPNYPEAHNNLGNLFKVQGRLDEAATEYRQALALKPDYADAHCNIGNVFQDQGKLDDAVAAYRQALALRPDYPEVHSNLGNTLNAQGKSSEAEAQYRRAIALKPNYAEAHSNLGHVLQARGMLEEAAAEYLSAISFRPNYSEAYYSLGNVLRDQGKLDAAVARYQQAISLRPDYPEAHNNLGNALKSQGLLGAAVAQYRRAISLKQNYPEAQNNLGNALKDQGKLDEALVEYQRASELKPEFIEARSNLLMSLHYSTRHSEADILVQAQGVARQIERPGLTRGYANARDPDRPLRIGYVSADFRDHPVGYFLERVLAVHDRANIEVTCYSNSGFADAMTARLREAAGQWRSIAGMPDAVAAELIQNDGIDILVDLSGHTANNRLPLFALKPAPVQVSWLGYFGTTGLAAMNYILADRFVIPTRQETCFTEKVWRLPDSYLCFSPPDLNVPVAVRPLNEPLALGCFNNWAKVSPATVSLWAEVLAAVSGATLLLKTKGLADPAIRQEAFDRFAAHGVAPERLHLEGHAPRAELLAAYNRVDIALDPLPYGGGTTTAEALWMGVPVVTLRGDRWVGRVSESIVATAGLSHLVADDRVGYVKTVATLANDRPQLRKLRDNLRSMVEGSPLCDGKRFVGSLETAYRGMWNAWCAGHTMEMR